MAVSAKLILTGVDELDEQLSFLHTRVAARIAKKALRAGAVVVARHIRRAIGVKNWVPHAADKGIGSIGKRAFRKNFFEAKAGASVGASQRKEGITVNRGKRKGVGISSRNIHWFAMGTNDRWTGAKSSGGRRLKDGTRGHRTWKKTGHPRRFVGKIDKAKFGGFVQRGSLAAKAEVEARMTKVGRDEIAKVYRTARGA